MANTLRSLSGAISKIWQSNPHPLGIFVLLVLVTIPLGYAAGSFSLALLVLATVLHYKKLQFRFNWGFFLPVALWLLMAISLLWTIDSDATSLAIVKELPLLLIPVIFMLAPPFDDRERRQVLQSFAAAMSLYAVYWLMSALVRFVLTGNPNVFFYHELVTLDLNAIHVSVFAAVAFFILQERENKPLWVRPAMWLLALLILLLSSKNVIVVFGLLLAWRAFSMRLPRKKALVWIGVTMGVAASVLVAVPQVRERFAVEVNSMLRDNTVNTELSRGNDKVYNVSISQAWNQERFEPNHFFPGAAFRVYQFRIFCEMMGSDGTFLTGFGLNASYGKIAEKTREDNLYQGNDGDFGYNKSNFHNQYVQAFAELGIFGFAILVAMLVLNLKKAFVSKDFAHISFAVLMISLFLTESFLWRQRGVIFFTVLYCLFLSGAAPARNNR